MHLTIPADYPQQPPTANFRTPIFHPNVEPQTGGVCVETLKRDWDPKLTLRDVLVTICCLLIQPNPDSALNAEAGSLIQDNYEAFARRAELMTSIHGVVPKALKEVVREAQMRGQDVAQAEDESQATSEEAEVIPVAPGRRRRTTARQRGTTTTRRSDGSPSGGIGRRHQHVEQSNPFLVQTRDDDIFGSAIPERHEEPSLSHDDDSSMLIDADQENDEARSPKNGKAPKGDTPRRRPGPPVPLGELTLESASPSDVEDSMEAEYPPSPRKSSPVKSPSKRRPQLRPRDEQPESSRDAAARNITPATNPFPQTLAHDSPYSFTNLSPSPRKARMLQETPKRAPLFPSLSTPREYGGVFKAKSPSAAEKKERERRRREEMDARLWRLCGEDVARWNRGDFASMPFAKRARRW